MKKIAIILPTYGERENISSLLSEILALDPSYYPVVVDDDSPDGTADIVSALAEKNSRITLIHRRGERGRGLAGAVGFRYGLAMGAEGMVEMDSDFSHAPKEIPRLVQGLEKADIVVGSRFVPGAHFSRPTFFRNAITHLAGAVIRWVTRAKLRDPTSGFRAYRREVIYRVFEKAPLISRGPSILEELHYKASLLGFSSIEVPITFEDRTRGKSTFRLSMALGVFLYILLLPFLFGYLRGQIDSSMEIFPSPPEDLEIAPSPLPFQTKGGYTDPQKDG